MAAPQKGLKTLQIVFGGFLGQVPCNSAGQNSDFVILWYTRVNTSTLNLTRRLTRPALAFLFLPLPLPSLCHSISLPLLSILPCTWPLLYPIPGQGYWLPRRVQGRGHGCLAGYSGLLCCWAGLGWQVVSRRSSPGPDVQDLRI